VRDPLKDQRPRIIMPAGEVRPIKRPLTLSGFAEALQCVAFEIRQLPKLPGFVMVLNADATYEGVTVNDAATAIYHHHYPDRADQQIRGRAAIVPDGHFGGFYG
jgi:hypothetical protein